jgi:hypothetical protein
LADVSEVIIATIIRENKDNPGRELNLVFIDCNSTAEIAKLFRVIGYREKYII